MYVKIISEYFDFFYVKFAPKQVFLIPKIVLFLSLELTVKYFKLMFLARFPNYHCYFGYTKTPNKAYKTV